ncbi:PREDICTED: ADAMTS-like protein 4 isoform X2 [Polistes dominula]|uniref:ADAMTS-like protein 4 isoform X2 n=1 Tax=Polistes dominula TaxID=743375 RepID=A0ABM1IMJ1_POLDO|nr:PREDICTED: ADAMTS-like protein 4 isoform X2 [Polistes dominula]
MHQYQHGLFYTHLLLTLTLSVISIESHLIDGIFTEPTLEPGYNLVATVPRGAVALNVTELRHTQNYLAIRLQNGSYLLNGNYSINWSGEYNAAGTTFLYIRQSQQNLESFSAAGPLHEPIDVMVLYQEPNPGIVYRYIIPGSSTASAPSNSHLTRNTVLNRSNEASAPSASTLLRKTNGTITNALTTIDDSAINGSYIPRRYKKRKFAWKPAGYTECNKSCGGGIQTMRYMCIREHIQAQVPDKRCHMLEKPREVRLKCNTNLCPPVWRPTAWSQCSVSCGTGVRIRDMECVQEIKPTLTVIVSEGACTEPRNLPISETCNEQPCEQDNRKISDGGEQSFNWIVGSWSECSTTCGAGKRTRLVTCEREEYFCNTAEKPISQEVCDLGPCTVKFSSSNAISLTEPRGTTTTTTTITSQWLYTEWSEQCSAECGIGMQSRRVFCEKYSDEECDRTNRPESSRSCSSNITCSGQWFVGPWSECSSNCDFGEKTREAVCVTTIRGALRVVLDMNCPANKPETRKSCRGPPCSYAWFTSDWSECSRSCGKGIQRREVKCLSPENTSNEYHHQIHCYEEDRPVSRRTCNDYPCKNDTNNSENLPRVSQVQDDPEIYNGLEDNPFCKDNIPNCALVIQARLCTYQFYQRSCCLSCSRAKHEPE